MAKDEAREMELLALMEKIGGAETAARALELSKYLRTLAERYKRDADVLTEKERVESERRAKAMETDFLTTFGAFVLDAVSTDAAALSVFDSFGAKLRDEIDRSGKREDGQAELERLSNLLAIHKARRPPGV